MHDTQFVEKTVSELLKKYYLPVHIEVLCRAYKKEVGLELPFQEFGFSSAAEFLKKGCGSSFEVMQSRTNDEIFYVTPKKPVNSKQEEPTKPEDPVLGRIREALKVLDVQDAAKNRTKVPPQFKQYLRFLIGRHPQGITVDNLVADFLRVSGSSLSYKMYGYSSYLEMFKQLPDVFEIRESLGQCVLYPLPDSRTSFSRTVNNQSKTNKSLPATKVEIEKRLPLAVGSALPEERDEKLRCSDVGVKNLAGGGVLVYVKLGEKFYVPTSCVATLADLPSDTIAKALDDQRIDVQGVETLSESKEEHAKLRYELALLNCPMIITRTGTLIKEILLVPLRSVPILLKVFGQKKFELDNHLRKIQNSCVKV